MDEEVTKEQIEDYIDKNIGPYIKKDGGSIIVVDYEDEIVRIKMFGACSTCGISKSTVDMIQVHLKKEFPEIDGVERVY